MSKHVQKKDNPGSELFVTVRRLVALFGGWKDSTGRGQSLRANHKVVVTIGNARHRKRKAFMAALTICSSSTGESSHLSRVRLCSFDNIFWPRAEGERFPGGIEGWRVPKQDAPSVCRSRCRIEENSAFLLQGRFVESQLHDPPRIAVGSCRHLFII